MSMVVRQDSQAGDGYNDDEIDRLDSGRQAFEELKASGGFDDVLAKIDAGELQLTGEGGFL
jgi:putative transposase